MKYKNGWFLLLLMVLIISSAVLYSLSAEEVGEELVPCIDKNNRLFVDELCIKKIYKHEFYYFGLSICFLAVLIYHTFKGGIFDE